MKRVKENDEKFKFALILCAAYMYILVYMYFSKKFDIMSNKFVYLYKANSIQMLKHKMQKVLDPRSTNKSNAVTF